MIHQHCRILGGERSNWRVRSHAIISNPGIIFRKNCLNFRGKFNSRSGGHNRQPGLAFYFTACLIKAIETTCSLSRGDSRALNKRWTGISKINSLDLLVRLTRHLRPTNGLDLLTGIHLGFIISRRGLHINITNGINFASSLVIHRAINNQMAVRIARQIVAPSSGANGGRN